MVLMVNRQLIIMIDTDVLNKAPICVIVCGIIRVFYKLCVRMEREICEKLFTLNFPCPEWALQYLFVERTLSIQLGQLSSSLSYTLYHYPNRISIATTLLAL